MAEQISHKTRWLLLTVKSMKKGLQKIKDLPTNSKKDNEMKLPRQKKKGANKQNRESVRWDA